jgi:hypothetical protein
VPPLLEPLEGRVDDCESERRQWQGKEEVTETPLKEEAEEGYLVQSVKNTKIFVK